jgi:hypothetical protein
MLPSANYSHSQASQGFIISTKSCVPDSDAKLDLNNAINLSNGKGRAGCQAFCQRGLILLKENHTEDAKADFEAAAKLGSQFAKAQLVQMNPYAALCNKMLRTVFTKLQNGDPVESDDDDKPLE